MPDCDPQPGRIVTHPVIRPGISIGDDGRIGTLGLLVVDAWETLCILSAWHVLSPGGQALDTPIQQPAPSEDSAAPRQIGTLWWFDERLDAALARVDSGISCSPEVLETGELVRSFRAPRLGDVLEKSGRTTGTTRGVVVKERTPAQKLSNAFILRPLDGDTEPISCKGDSGAVWYDPETGEGVGLHHGAPDDEDVAVAVSIPLIQAAWDFEPWNGTFLPPDGSDA